MLQPTIKKNKKITAYRQWLSEKRNIGKVIPIEFIGFKYKHYRGTKPYPFSIDGFNFIGEIWRCVDEKGNFLECTFKHFIDNSYKTNSSLTPNKNPILDGFEPNLLLDSYDEFSNNMVNKGKNPNKNLLFANKKHKKRMDSLRELLEESKNAIEKEGCFYILRHKESPTLPTLRTVQKFRNENPETYSQIIQKINT